MFKAIRCWSKFLRVLAFENSVSVLNYQYVPPVWSPVHSFLSPLTCFRSYSVFEPVSFLYPIDSPILKAFVMSDNEQPEEEEVPPPFRAEYDKRGKAKCKGCKMAFDKGKLIVKGKLYVTYS